MPTPSPLDLCHLRPLVLAYAACMIDSGQAYTYEFLAIVLFVASVAAALEYRSTTRVHMQYQLTTFRAMATKFGTILRFRSVSIRFSSTKTV